MSQITVTSSRGAWTGPELAGPEARRLLRVYGETIARVMAAPAHGAAQALAAAPRAEELFSATMKGWTMPDGEPATVETDDLIEPWGVLLEVLMLSGFFGHRIRALVVAARAKEAKKG